MSATRSLSATRPTAAVVVPRNVTPPLRSRLRASLPAYGFLLPWLIGLVVLTIGPMALSLYYSFSEYSLLAPPEWIGLDNYREMFSDPRYLASARVTLTYVLVSVPLEMVIALGVAMLLNRGLRGIAAYRAVYYVPSLLGGSVAIAILWREIFGSEGLVNDVLGWFGIESGSWVTNPDTSLWTLIILRVWQFGAPMVIFLAGLRQIPSEVLEAAQVDGAGAVRRFLRITLPLLSPIVFFNLVLQIIGSFQAFTPAYIVSGGSGGPADSTLFYTLYLYQEAFGNFRMGYAAAMAWVLLLVIAAFTAANFLMSRFWVFYESDTGGSR
ncbi:binding-protein-dependent transport systems inner membrane component [Beutenbergia cavernae DSM 12333]|uniref:Binding-protein-dependent transport systems inner membrane component n=1 Tax=Beutenbergia cavernae (strain ATCC BAA-8 / DSM 12333 / CCUG 43141 / JCM 11478 / NBRC 16432 / NCIMB 13614 / HKI 0122) TaxID=471853 RepID=C5C4L6_BEUC1|nr:sugar ABC transporter permease [Beutenbergia cavernae]ACQ82140.1 binding-protein-dependent transport systems inner membrane component [Beutenbergia cavernae DSM 12333]